MEGKTGVISFNGETKAQVQIIDDKDGTRRVQLYSKSGIYLCGCHFGGDDDAGYALGQALYEGYVSGWNKAQYAISRNVTKALYAIQDYTTI